MSNAITIFDAITTDTISSEFRTILPDSKNFADTEFSAYLEIFGGIGGGVLNLQKKCVDGTFKTVKRATDEIADKFPAAGEVLIIALNYKSGESFRLELAGATGATLTVGGINLKFAA